MTILVVIYIDIGNPMKAMIMDETQNNTYIKSHQFKPLFLV